MSRMIRAALAAVLLPAAQAAWAADATPEQARSLEAAVRAWLAEMAGPSIPLPDRPVQIAAEGDHYRVTVGVGKADGATLTGTARPIEGGRWSLDGFRFSTPARFTLDMPQPAADGRPASTVSVNYVVNAASQNWQALWDPSFATPSTVTSTAQGLDMTANSNILQQQTRIERIGSTSTIRPAAPGRVDVVSNGTADNYSVSSKADGTEQLQIAMQHLRVNMELTGVSRERAARLTQAAARLTGSLIAAMPASDGKGGPAQPAKPDPQAVKALLEGLQDFATALSVEEAIDGLSVRYGNQGGMVSKAGIGINAQSLDGMLQARMDLSFEGLSLPDLPLGDMADLLPRRLAIRPVVSGVAVADLVRLVNSSGEGREPSQADIAALFSHGGIATGLESFNLDVAGTTFTGTSKVLVRSPQQVSASAQITATNFDALMQRVGGMPALAQAMPVFVLAKGIGRTVDNRLVWDVSYVDGKVLVNNVDLNALAAGGQPPPQRQQPQRQPPQQGRPNSANPR